MNLKFLLITIFLTNMFVTKTIHYHYHNDIKKANVHDSKNPSHLAIKLAELKNDGLRDGFILNYCFINANSYDGRDPTRVFNCVKQHTVKY